MSTDTGHMQNMMQEEFRFLCFTIGEQQQRPSVLFRPRLFVEGDMWCALYGDNLQDGVCGFGHTPAGAIAAFDAAWHQPITASTGEGPAT